MSERTRKLVALRNRTDHDLVVVVNRELDRGLNMLSAAISRNSPLYTQAEKALGTATALLSRVAVAALSAEDRHRIDTKANELRLRLEQVPVCSVMRSFPASLAS
jgi:hypothetical protein